MNTQMRDCLVIGSGRMAGGFVVPLLREAGWSVTLACRSAEVRDAITRRGGIWLEIDGGAPRWIDQVRVVSLDPGDLHAAVATTALIVTAVGPTVLNTVGRQLAPALRARLDATGTPVNIVAFENHRRAAEQLAGGLLACEPSLAREIGTRIGVGGAAVWRTISRRTIADDGLHVAANAEATCYVDALALLREIGPCDGSVPGIACVRAFDDRMVEKLWVFNAGHCAAAYFGWQRGCTTLDAALELSDVRDLVRAVIEEARQGFMAYLGRRPGSVSIEPWSAERILEHYRDPSLNDPVTRVAREPRRKLAREDRLIGPALACLAAGIEPRALASAAAAALAYDDADDTQASDIQRELAFLNPTEVLSTICQLDACDELMQSIVRAYWQQASRPVGGGHM